MGTGASYFDDVEFVTAGIIPSFKNHYRVLDQDRYALNYLSEGEMYFEYPHGERVEFKKPMLYWTSMEGEYRFGNLTEDFRGHFFISFRGERVKKWIDSGLLNLREPFRPVRQPGEVHSLFEDLVLNFKRQHPEEQYQRVFMIEKILSLHLQPDIDMMKVDRKGELMARVVSDMKKDPLRDWDWSALSKDLNMSLTHFRRLFRKQFHVSPLDYLLNLRMRQASILIENNEGNVSEVARMVGYENVYYFSRLFKSKVGCSPSEYAKLARDSFVER